MKLQIKITSETTNEQVFEEIKPQLKKMISELSGGMWEINIQKPKRTLQQNKALHKYFAFLAEAFNEAGLDMKKVIKKDVQIPWYTETIKNFIWRPIQKSVLGEKSTTRLNTLQIDEVYAVLNRHIGEQFGIYVPFPCEISRQQNNEIT